MTANYSSHPLIDWFFDNQGAEHLGAAAGLDAESARRVLRQGLPLQLQEIADYARTPLGSEQIGEAISIIPNFPSVNAALAAGNGALDLERAGDSMSATIMREHQGRIADSVSGQVRVGRYEVGRLLNMTLPLLLSRLSWRDPVALGFLPLLASVPVKAAPSGFLTPTDAVVASQPVGPRVHTRAEDIRMMSGGKERRGGIPWWWLLLPLILLLMLGGCWTLNKARPSDNNAAVGSTVNGQSIIVASPSNQSDLPHAPFTLRGKAPAGTDLVIRDSGTQMATAKADSNGQWSATIPTPELGQHTYSVEGGNAKSEVTYNVLQRVTPSGKFTFSSPQPDSDVSSNGFTVSGTGKPGEQITLTRGSDVIGTFRVGEDGTWSTDVLDSAAPAGNNVYEFRGPQGNLLGRLPVKLTPVAGVTPVTVTDPAVGAQVPDGGFNISGTGTPGAVYQTYEDGSNIGSFTVAPDGTWSADVPGPAEGDHTYTILDERGNRVARVPVTVVTSGGSAECTDDVTISLNDNETVSAPFRFGGRGSAKEYTVSVWRDDRKVGERQVALSAACTWSYASDPGGQEGERSEVRYEVRPSGSEAGTEPTAKVDLKVSGSGTNFGPNGEYVGPTQ